MLSMKAFIKSEKKQIFGTQFMINVSFEPAVVLSGFFIPSPDICCDNKPFIVCDGMGVYIMCEKS